MPELPEVETMRRGILPVVGSCIESVEFLRLPLKSIRITPRPANFVRRVSGRQIQTVDRVAKRVLVRLDNDDAIVFEPRMTGLVLLADAPDESHLRCRFALSSVESPRLMFWDRRGLGSVRLFSKRQLDEELGPAKLGPDALVISADEMRARLEQSRREIKVALLDQKAVAGVGNLYASEMLHAAGIHPRRRCDRLTRAQWAALHAAMQSILLDAIRYEGSTLADGTYRNALNQAGGYQNEHRVYAKAGELCPTCGEAAVVRIVQVQRSTYYCPVCQKRPR